jgi:ABC-type bacteriocin/lantibiotic exporter with double-glycine peptidase domain
MTNTTSRLIAGIALIVFGVYLFWLAIKVVWVLVYAIPLFLIGWFVLFNKKEDQIERRKDLD